MTEDDLDRFIDQWAYQIGGVLNRQLEALKDELRSDDKKVRKAAELEADQILDWLLPPSPPFTYRERLRKAEEAIADQRQADSDRLAAAMRALRSTGRRRGRPRTTTSQHAIHALTLHLTTPKSWREIALEVRGCKHKRPRLERSCVACGDAIRDAVGRLEKFLRSKGYHPNVPRRVEIHSLRES
jgi:hypothetical protein